MASFHIPNRLAVKRKKLIWQLEGTTYPKKVHKSSQNSFYQVGIISLSRISNRLEVITTGHVLLLRASPPLAFLRFACDVGEQTSAGSKPKIN